MELEMMLVNANPTYISTAQAEENTSQEREAWSRQAAALRECS